MSIERTLICDKCSRVIAAAGTARKVRADARQSGYRRVDGKDLCWWCVEGLGVAKRSHPYHGDIDGDADPWIG